MNELSALELLANNCLHCGEKPKAYHQDYNGDTYVGSEYCFECSCGITTNWVKSERLLTVWNAKYKN